MENRLRNAFIYSFANNIRYLKDLIIINTKCLIDDRAKKVVYIDYGRLKDELVFYKYYGEKCNDSVYGINFILPIILCNINMKKSEDEIVKNISYYCKASEDVNINIYDYILAGVAYNYLMHSLIKDCKLKIETVLEDIKKYIIEFSLEEKLEENEKLEKSEVIRFERSRIYFIQKIGNFFDNGLGKISEENVVDGFLRVLYQIYVSDFQEKDEELKSLKNSILGVLDFKFDEVNINDIDFIKSLSEYILKVRKYEINKKIYEGCANPRELISLNVGDTVYNSVLNNIKVMDKKIEDNVLYMKVQSKSGEYNFRFRNL